MGRLLDLTPGAAGCDEAGRGALAGPVVCAAVILPDGFDAAGLDDSKKLTREQREAQAVRIQAEACWAVVCVEHTEIDEINILQASLVGVARAVYSLKIRPERVLMDGHILPPIEDIPCECLIKGDGSIAAIAAASILAKTTRDRIMREMAPQYPEYGFDSHVGYAAPVHLEAIKRHGPCAIHRLTFDPVRTMLMQPCLSLDS